MGRARKAWEKPDGRQAPTPYIYIYCILYSIYNYSALTLPPWRKIILTATTATLGII